MASRNPKPVAQLPAAWLALLFVAAAACAPAEPVPVVQPAPGVQPAAAPLTDAAVADIAVTANTGEIQEGQLALQRSTNPAVREFAQRMVSDHTFFNQQINEAMGRQQMGTAGNPLSQQLQQNSSSAQQTLQALTGPAFDQAYMRRQVEQHQWLLNAMDTSLIPGAQDRELRTVLEAMRPAVAEHLQQARQIQGTLGQQQPPQQGHH